MKSIFFVSFGFVASFAFVQDVSATTKRAPLAVHIRQSSLGAGIDSEAAKVIRSVLAAELSQGSLVGLTTTRWGREGEIDICAEFESNEAMLAAKSLLGKVSSDRVALAENGSCK